jgi:hypothetical protein
MSTIAQSPINRARDNKFVLVISIPPGLKETNSITQRDNSTINIDSITYNVFGTMVPDIVVPAVSTPYTGGNIYVSSHTHPPHPPIRVDFVVDNNFDNYWTIYQWLNLIRDQKEGEYGITNARNLINTGAVLKDYSTIFNLFAADEMNKNVMRWDYHNAFPTKLGGITWNYQKGTEISCYFEFVFSNIICTRL